jgi:hypothetical protein
VVKEMEYLRALSVHFAALVLLFMGVTGLLASIFGNFSFETDRSFTSIGAGSRSRRLNAFLATLSLAVGGGILVLAVREFRPPSYALLVVGSLIVVAVVALALKSTLRSVEAMESAMAKGTLFLVNGVILALLLMAAFYVGQYLWRAFVAT